MSHQRREPQRHIHDDLSNSLNEASICIKVHHVLSTEGKSDEEVAKIMKVRSNHHCPTWAEIATLLEQAIIEVNQCTEQYKKY